MGFPKFVPALLLAAAALQGFAQDLPPSPIRLLVGFAPGGGNDVIARSVATQFQLQTKETMVVENKPGGGSTVATAEMARARPTGQTLLLGSVGGQAIAPAVYSRLPYDPIKGVQAVSLVAKSANALVVNAELPVKSVAELIAYAKTHPGRLNVTSPGNGTISHLSAELFKNMAGVFITHIPYRGAGPALQDLIAGNVDLMFDGLGSSAQHIKAGRIKALLVSGARRNPAFPDVPCAAEVGLPDYTVTTWYGLWAPKGTPADVQTRAIDATRKAMAADDLRGIWAANGSEIPDVTAAAFGGFVNAEIRRWATVVKASGTKLD